MGSKTFFGVWFTSYSDDHLPPHVHGELSGVRVVFDLLTDGSVRISLRPDAIEPKNAKQNIVRRIVRVATLHAVELHSLWEQTHGPVSNGK